MIAKPVFRSPFVKKVKVMPDVKITAFKKSGIVRVIRSSAAHVQIAAMQTSAGSFAPKDKSAETSLIANMHSGKIAVTV